MTPPLVVVVTHTVTPGSHAVCWCAEAAAGCDSVRRAPYSATADSSRADSAACSWQLAPVTAYQLPPLVSQSVWLPVTVTNNPPILPIYTAKC
jgi:hypothetical protein